MGALPLNKCSGRNCFVIVKQHIEIVLDGLFPGLKMNLLINQFERLPLGLLYQPTSHPNEHHSP